MGVRALNIIDKLNQFVGRWTSYITLAVMGGCVIEVVCRFVFNKPTRWAYEFEQLSFAIFYILIGGYVLYLRGHVSIEILYARFGPRIRAFLDLCLTYPLLLIMSVGLAYIGLNFAVESMEIWEHSYTSWAPPIWPTKLALPIGSTLLALQVLANYIRRIIEVGRGAL